MQLPLGRKAGAVPSLVAVAAMTVSSKMTAMSVAPDNTGENKHDCYEQPSLPEAPDADPP